MKQITSEHIFNATNIGFLVTNAEGSILKLNKNTQDIFGRKEASAVGRSVSIIFPLVGEYILKALSEKINVTGAELTENGISIVLNVSLIREENEILGAIAYFYEFSFMENLAKKFEFYKLQNKELNAIFQSVHDALWVCDGRGRVLNINKASEKLNQISRQDVLGKHVTDLVEEGMFDTSVTMEVLQKKKQVTLVQSLGKTKKKILATGTPVLNEKGEISLVVVNSRDMSSLNFIKEQLEKSLEESSKLRDVLQEMSLEVDKKQTVVGESQAIQSVLKVAMKLSRMDVTNILLLGESGTGKGLMAKFIHKNSVRKDRTFMQINCAALPENLLEAELFGYEKGAFTGAKSKGKIGLIELSENGTLFLDEIGELPLHLQSKLLKYFDDREVMRLGGTKSKVIDCAIIAATNRDLEVLVNQNLFRQDLFYRINTFTLTLPPLRERKEDILDIVNHYLNKYNAQFKTQKRIRLDVFHQLQNYAFPGNIRELKNIIKKGVVLSESEYLDDYLSRELQLVKATHPRISAEDPDGLDLKQAMAAYEKQILMSAMETSKTTRAIARKLGIDHSTVVRKLKRHDLVKPGA